METKEPLVLNLEEELLSQFGVPKGTPLENVPWQFLRRVMLDAFEPTVDFHLGTKLTPFFINKEVAQEYYNAYDYQPNDMHWIDPRYRFFGNFYQIGDNSQTGYLSEKIQTQEERTLEEVSGIINLLKLPKESSIVDCPCGIGRHTIELARRKYRMLAVDLNYDQIKVGIKTANKDEVIKSLGNNRIIFALDSMLNIGSYPKQKNVFDAVTNLFYSFGFFDKEEQNEKVAKNFFNLLKPGGKFLMHTDVNMTCIKSGRYKFKENRTLRTGETLKIIDYYNPNTKRIDGVWIIENQEKRYSVRVYENEEFVDLCKRVGFKNVKIYSDWNGSPYNEESEIVIFVAEK